MASYPRRFVPFVFLGLILLVGGAYALYRDRNGLPIVPPRSEVTVVPSPKEVAETAAAVPSEWPAYTDTDYGVTFSYPASYPQPAVQSYVAGTFGVPVDFRVAAFPANAPALENREVNIALSRLAGYRGTAFGSAASRLEEAYKNRSATGIDPTVLMPKGSKLAIATEPQYIQSVGGQFRGIAFYGWMGNQYPSGGQNSVRLNNLVLLLTDGTRVFQLLVTDPYTGQNQSGQEAAIAPSCLPAGIAYRCAVSRNLAQSYEQSYSIIAKSLSSAGIRY